MSSQVAQPRTETPTVETPKAETCSLSLEQLRRIVLSRYANFCRFFQEDGWFDPTHEQLCDWVQAHVTKAYKGSTGVPKDILLTVTMPRGSLKTTIITKYLPVWLTLAAHYEIFPAEWNIDKSLRTLITTNTQPNARGKLRGISGLIREQWFQTLFPEILPDTSCRNSGDSIDLNLSRFFDEGHFESAGTGTQKTGTHYNLLIEDDTVAPDESDIEAGVALPSRERVEKGIVAHQKMSGTMCPKGFRMRVVVSTRWGSYDLLQWIWDNEPGYSKFDAPAIRGADVANWRSGTPVFSMFYSMDKLEEMESSYGPFLFACLILNCPQDLTLKKFKPEWLRQIVLPSQVPAHDCFYTIAIDPAISEKDSACESSITTVCHQYRGTEPIQFWTRDQTGHYDPSTIIDRTLDEAEAITAAKGLVRAIIVESVAFQKALKYALYDAMQRRGQWFPLIEFSSRQQKELRIEGVLVPKFSLGRIYFVRGGLSEDARGIRVIQQLLAFPTGRLIDIADSFSMHAKIYSMEKSPISEPNAPDPTDPFMAEAAAIVARGYSGTLSDPITQPMPTGLGLEFDALEFISNLKHFPS